MKASTIFSGLLLSLLLCTISWAQDEESAEAAAAELIEQAGAAGELVEDAEAAVQAVVDEVDAADTAQTGTDSAAIEVDEAEAIEPDTALVDEQPESEADAEAETEPEPEPIAAEPAEANVAIDDAVSAVPPASTDIFIFQGHPIFTSDQAELVYRPLVNYLNDVLPYRFELDIAPDFHRYWLSTRRGEHPHLIFEEPHLTALRIDRYGFTPLVRAAEPLTYSLLTIADDGDSSVRDFIARPVSTMPAPSLGYLILASWFDNPMQQPMIQSSASSWLDAVEIVFSGEADAAMVPNNLVERYVNLENVLTSREFPGVTISASPAVSISIQEEIRDALLALHEDESHYVALHELDIERFEIARRSEYLGLDSWLGLVYGNY